jgi:hypothetical protein
VKGGDNIKCNLVNSIPSVPTKLFVRRLVTQLRVSIAGGCNREIVSFKETLRTNLKKIFEYQPHLENWTLLHMACLEDGSLC